MYPLFVWTAVGVLGSYVLWVLFIFVYTNALENISRSSWHWSVYKFSTESLLPSGHLSKDPLNLCEYRKGFYKLPLVCGAWALIGVIIFVMVVLKFFWDWVAMPLVFGEVPAIGIRSEYWSRIPDPIPYRVVTSENHPVYFSIGCSIILFSVEAWRFVRGSSGKIESCIFFVLVALNVIVFVVRWPHTRSLWKSLRERLCVTVPVVD